MNYKRFKYVGFIVLFLIIIQACSNDDTINSDPVNELTDTAVFVTQETMLDAPTQRLRDNKRLAYDFCRIVVQAGRAEERAADFLANDLIEHNPNLPSGLDEFVAAVSEFAEPSAIQDQIVPFFGRTLISITAERDIVMLVFSLDVPAEGATPAYSTAWFEMFRIEDGKIAEHWDPATLPIN